MGASQSKPKLYERLRKRQIRLVQIDKSNQASQTISCRMTVHQMKKAPPYKALSYVCGDQKVTATIIVNGVTMQKTTNLVAALHRLRELDEDIYYWIDAICISQEDNAEKSAQVQAMGAVYMRATETTVWLGEGSEDSDLGMSFLNRWKMAGEDYFEIRKRLTKSIDPGHTPESFALGMGSYNNAPEITGLLKHLLDNVQNPYGPLEWEAMARLFSRPYWQRVWIIQEVTLARKVTLHCGHAHCTFKLVPIFMPIVELMMVCDTRSMWAYYGLQDLQNFELQRKAVLNGMQPTLVVAGNFEDGQPLSDHLRVTGLSLTTDRRDKVYALLSLVPPLRTRTKVDYSKTAMEVYTDFVLSEIRITGKLEPIHMYQPETLRELEGLPSWVPDLSSKTSSLIYKPVQGRFIAAGMTKAHAKASRKRTRLTVRGVRQCIVKNADEGAPLTLVRGRDPEEAVVAEVLPRWFALAETSLAVDLAPGFDVLQTFFRTICHDDSNTGPPDYMPLGVDEAKELADSASSYCAWASQQSDRQRLPTLDVAPFVAASTIVMETMETDSSHVRIDGPSAAQVDIVSRELDNALVARPDAEALQARRFIQDFCLLAQASGFFVTEDGRMGTGPKGTQPGDIVCVLLGAGLPTVLRPQGKHYTVVGPCYMYGLMYAQAIKEVNKGMRQVESFELR